MKQNQWSDVRKQTIIRWENLFFNCFLLFILNKNSIYFVLLSILNKKLENQ